MTISLELMDAETGNLVGSYETAAGALATVLTAYAEDGEAGVGGLMLILIREDGSQQLISEDLDIVRLALGHRMAAISS